MKNRIEGGEEADIGSKVTDQGKTIKAKRELSYGTLLSICFVHAMAGFAIWYAVVHGFSLKNWMLFGVLSLFTGLGITVGYHRMLTHRGFQCGRILRCILSVFGGMAAQGPEHEWVANHRVHHYFADKEGDPHSPRAYPGLKGLLWSHVFWLFFKYERPRQYQIFRDLDEDPVVRWQKRFYLPIVALGLVIPFMTGGLAGVLLAGFLRMVCVWNITWSVNSICHLLGTMAKDSEGQTYTDDDSRNNILVALLGFGEGYHANHHVRPRWAYHGWNWYSLDVSKWLIQLLALLGWVWNVQRPDKVIRFVSTKGCLREAHNQC